MMYNSLFDSVISRFKWRKISIKDYQIQNLTAKEEENHEYYHRYECWKEIDEALSQCRIVLL